MLSHVHYRALTSNALQITAGFIALVGRQLGAAGFAENSQLDTQIYSPDHLFNNAGNTATRPVFTDAPVNVNTGQIIRVGVDSTSTISGVTFVKTQSVTHSVQMSTGFFDLSYDAKTGNELEIRIPSVAEGMDTGEWMMFIWNASGTPSIASILRVNRVPVGANFINLLLNGDLEIGSAGSGVEPPGWTLNGAYGRHEKLKNCPIMLGMNFSVRVDFH